MIRFEFAKKGPHTKTNMCSGCGEHFRPQNPNQRFCNTKCKRNYYHKKNTFKKVLHLVKVKKYCPMCGIFFKIQKPNQKFCNIECKRAYLKEKKLENSIKKYCIVCGKLITGKGRKYCEICKKETQKILQKKLKKNISKDKLIYYKRFYLRRLPLDYEYLKDMDFKTFCFWNNLSKTINLNKVIQQKGSIENVISSIYDYVSDINNPKEEEDDIYVQETNRRY